MPQPRSRRAIVVGGSMAGLFSAAYLRRIGWHVDVYERSAVELVGRGAGITTHPELLDALTRCGARLEDLGIEVEKRIAIDRDGRVIGERPLRQILTSWDRLQRLLRETAGDGGYHLGHDFAGVEQNADGVTVRFANGRSERGDLLIGGDGIRSSVRAQVAPDVQPVYAGYYIWRGAPNEADLAPETLSSIFPYFTFFLPPGEQVIGYPISGFDNDLSLGRRRYNFIWYRVGDAETLRRMCVDENGHQHEHSVPPPLVRKSLIAEMRADAARVMPRAFLDVLGAMRQPFFTPINDLSTPRLVCGRVVLAGDAASSSRPHMGFGVAKAGGDAKALAAALAETPDDIDAALARYDAERQPFGHRVMLHARKLGTYFGVGLRTEADYRMQRVLSNPFGQMDWIAVPDFLDARASA